MNRRTALWTMAAFAASTRLKASPQVDVFAKENLLAWCIVPFDGNHRGPRERAEMLKRLGITRFAYDGRASDFAVFDQEWAALRANGITLQAVWLSTGLAPQNDPHVKQVLRLLESNQVRTQLWWPLSPPNNFDTLSEKDKFHQAGLALQYLAEQTQRINCSLALYGNGGWAGDPDHQLQLVEQAKLPGVGIVYNFEHAYDHLDRFASIYPKLVPYLMATNLNGMRKGPPEVRTIGQGDLDLSMLNVVRDSGYKGPIGIMNPDRTADAELGLQQNMDGLKKLLLRMNDSQALLTY